MSRRAGARAGLGAALALLSCAAAAQAPDVPAPASPAPPAALSVPSLVPATAAELLVRLEAAWKTRDTQDYLSLWRFPSPEVAAAEAEFVNGHFAGQTELTLRRPEAAALEREAADVSAQLFTIHEPRAALDQVSFHLGRVPGGWAIVGRHGQGRIDGLLHLSLDERGFRADGMVLRLEDFELTFHRGTLFTTPESLGPTALVFVGEGSVRFHPSPPTEREQLRQFCGAPELAEPVRGAFVRLHPADLHAALGPARREPDPDAPRRLPAARKLFDQYSGRSFVLDAALPGAPWWLLPGLGDALVTFQTRRHGTLTFTATSGEPEGLSLFDREKRRQICLYPAAGGSTRYDEDSGRTADVLSHNLRVRFDPERTSLSGEDTLRVALLQPALTLKLRLAEKLRVLSVTSREAGSHLFFRVRNQDTLMVSLGQLSGSRGEIQLSVRFAGTLPPAPVEAEGVQIDVRVRGEIPFEEIPLEEILTYTNRVAWYPTAPQDDHASARLLFDVPAGYLAVTGGERVATRNEGDRTLVEYVQAQPGKYISVAVGRLQEAAAREEGALHLTAYGTSRTRSDAERQLDTAADILRFYASQFGPCPYDHLNLVLAEARTPGGHSPPGMILLTRRPGFLRGELRPDPASVNDDPSFFLAHELAHQWWGHGVAGSNYRERWLSEAMAHYAAALWVRESQGEDAFRDTLRRMARWALERSDEGPINLGHRLGHVRDDPQSFRAVVYDKGACVLHMLRGMVGDEAFQAALSALQSQHRYGKIGSDDLREALEAASGLGLSAYFDEWVFGTRLPVLSVRHRSVPAGSGFRTQVAIAATGLPGPVPLELTVVHDAGRETRRVSIEGHGGNFEFATPGRVRRVDVNADYGLLARIERHD